MNSMQKEKIQKKKGIRSINPLKLIKRVYSAGDSEAWKQLSSSSIPLRYFCVVQIGGCSLAVLGM